MKKYLVLLLFLLSTLVFSQTLNIHKTDGTVDNIERAKIDSVTFTTINTTVTFSVHETDGTVDNVEIAKIDSVTFTTIDGTSCPGTPTVTYEGQTYHTVQIGDQCWLKENLNVGTRIDGALEQSDGNGIEKYCYDNDESNCDTYGGLYQWNEAMQYVTTGGTQGICPEGWHLPKYSEAKVLLNIEATKLIDENAKSGYTYTNETSFSALFSGARYESGGFYVMNYSANFWVSAKFGDKGLYLNMFYDRADVIMDNIGVNNAFSIRCLKN